MSTQYIRWPSASSNGGVPTYATAAAFPVGPSDGQLAIALDSHLLYEYNLGLLTWQVIGGANLVLSIGTVDSQTPSANGAVIASNALVMQSASATVPGLMSTAAQTFAGIKTFNASIVAAGGVDAAGTLTLGSAATTINIGNAGSVVNIQGTTIYENTPILQVVDPKITLNTGGGAGSGQNSGFEIEEAGSIAGYVQTSAARTAYELKAPASAGVVSIVPGIAPYTIDQGSHNPVTIGTANGLSLSTQILSLAAAGAASAGAVTTGTQTFAGAKTFTGDTTLNANLILAGTVNSSLTGANARISSHIASNVTFTNVGLTSIASANNGGVASGHLLCLTNETGASITIVNNYGGAAAGEAIYTGAAADIVIPNHSSFFLQYNGTASAWLCIVSGINFIGTLDAQAKSANGATQLGNILYLQTADATNAGLVGTAAQTFAGAKTFSSAPILSSLTASLPLKLDASKNVTAAAINLSGSEVTSTLPIGNGGTGATTQQAAINALTGTQTNAYYLRSNGTNASLSALAAADLSGAVAIANGGTGQTTASAGFDALSPNTTKGDITVRSSSSNTRLAVGADGQVLVADSSQTLGVKWATAAQGAKNYITYNNFENNATTGWSLSHTTLNSNIPDQASGSWTSASGNLSMSVISSGQLAGSYSLSLASSAATTAGDMLVSQAYTIDLEDQAKPLTFKFYYSAVSNASNLNLSGTSANTYQIYIYDTVNSAWIQPAGVYGMTQSSGVGYVTGTFQTPSNMTSFRIAVVCINASAGANTIYFDDFFLGPQTAPLGAAAQDVKSYTPTWTGLGTVSATTVYYRREGDSLVGWGFVTAGTTAASLMTMTLPNLSVDTAKISNNAIVGKMSANATPFSGGMLSLTASPTVLNFTADNASYAGGVNGNTWGNTTSFSFEFKVPIAGWSSNVQMSSDTDTRIVDFEGYVASNQALTANTTNLPLTARKDSHAAWGGSSYTVPVSGDYLISAVLINSSGTGSFYTYLNGSSSRAMFTGTTTSWLSGSVLWPNLKAGDVISIRNNASLTVLGDAGSTVMIQRLSGPAVVAATETVTASYTTAAGQSISNSTTDIINFDTKDFDTHGAVTTGASWKFTAPISGFYNVSSVILFASSAATQGNAIDLQVFKNGSVYKRMSYKTIESTFTNFIGTQGQASVTLNAGDYIDIRVSYNRTGGNTSLHNSSTYNHVEISRIK